MREQNSYSQAAALTVGTPLTAPTINDLPISGICVVATVAGNVSILLTGGQTLVVAVPTGTTILPLAAIGVNTSGTTATAVYSALA